MVTKESNEGSSLANKGTELRLSVVIPTFNAQQTIGAQLEALLAENDVDLEVLVVDNSSTDETAKRVHEWIERDGRVRLVEASQRKGVSYVRNTGILKARFDEVAICDSDDIVATQWVRAMAEALSEYELVTGPLEVHSLNPGALAESRGVRAENEPPTFYGVFKYAHGCNIGINRRTWKQLEGFDEDVLSCEDMLFGLKAHREAIDVHFEPRAIVHYRYRDSAEALFKQGAAYGQWRVFVYKSAREAGLGVPSRWAGWQSWAYLLRLLPQAATGAHRLTFSWVAGNRWGQLVGSWRFRSVFL